MAIYHFTVKAMSRAQGRNAVAGAAYRHGQNMTDRGSGQVFTNATHQDVEHCEISVPEDAPAWAKELLEGDVHQNSEKLWSAVENFEKRVDAQVYRDIEFALPHELNKEERLALAREFISEQFVARGMIADWCIHNHQETNMGIDGEEGIEKPHVHVMLTLREAIDAEKDASLFEKIKRYVRSSIITLGMDKEASSICFGPKIVAWNSKVLLKHWRRAYAETANTHLAKAGLDIRLDHRSYEDQGVSFIPQPKLGKAVSEMHQKGKSLDRFEEMKRVADHNKFLIQQNPKIVLEYITRYQATFTRQDIARVLNRYIHEVKEFQYVFARIEASSALVKLKGFSEGERILYTTHAQIRLEKNLKRCAKEMSQSVTESSKYPDFFVSDKSLEKAIHRGNETLNHVGGLSTDQVMALQHMVAPEQLKVIVGYAGSGKTTLLKLAKDLWEEAGYRVVGAAPTGKAADGVSQSGIFSQTLHKWDHAWQQGRSALNDKTIFILDEAGMVESRRLNALLQKAQQEKFKIVLVGDPEQLPPIEAGAPLRAIMEESGFAALSTIVRQQKDWQRALSQQLALRKTKEVLNRYHQEKRIHFHKKEETPLIEDWITHQRERILKVYGDNNVQSPLTSSLLSSSLILAYTNEEVTCLNHQAREALKREGLIDPQEHVFSVSKPLNLETLEREAPTHAQKSVYEDRSFAVSDTIVFGRNDYGIGVTNGQRAVITEIQEGLITVQKEDGTSLTFDAGSYCHIDYGYAVTIHKSQGTTVDRTFVAASPYMDQHLTYVALTRHKEDVGLYVDGSKIADKDVLLQALAKEHNKENALDYPIKHISDLEKDITQRDTAGFYLRRLFERPIFTLDHSTLSQSWDLTKAFTKKAWATATHWLASEQSAQKKEERVKEEAIQTVTQKYGLTDYLTPEDPTQKLYIEFAYKNYRALNVHYQFNLTNEDLAEKSILTGLTQHMSTTLDRLQQTLSEERLQETYERAATAATIFDLHLKQQKRPLSMSNALDQANAFLKQERQKLKNYIKENPSISQKTKTFLQEKSRLQTQMGRKLTEEQNHKLHQDVETLHQHSLSHASHQDSTLSAHKAPSLTQHLFGEAHSLTIFKQEILQTHQLHEQTQVQNMHLHTEHHPTLKL